jgi:hypothetical protein
MSARSRFLSGAAGRVAAAVASLVVVWLMVPGSVPVYDGVGAADEPYRYVNPPVGYPKTPPPTTARATLSLTQSGLNQGKYANSDENLPQVSYFVPNGALKAPIGATDILVTAAPVTPPVDLPADGTIVGNVYRITATTAKGAAVIVGKGISQLPTLDMRAPTAKQPGPVFESLVGGAWKRSPTLRIGVDIYQTSAPTLGDWALVRLNHPPGAATGGVNVGLLAGGIAVIALVVVVTAIRINRGHRGDRASAMEGRREVR